MILSPKELNTKYFSPNSRGYKIISKFYYKYYDLFVNTSCGTFTDFRNQIYLNLSSINFYGKINNLDAYIISAMKIQCRVQLDKAIKQKKIIPVSKIKDDDNENSDSILETGSANSSSNPAKVLEGDDIFNHINIFRLSLKPKEAELLNFLIDEKSRAEIAENTKMKMNTIDTNIRRLRLKLFNYLKKIGYNLNEFKNYES